MLDEKLPYRVFDADNHFYEPPGILEKYLESKFHDRVAVDYTPEKAAQHNAKIRAELEQRKKEGGVIPGMALNKMNPLRDKSAEERERIVEEFRAPADPYYDGLWGRLAESGVRPVVHLGYTGYQVAGKYFGYDPDMHYFDGFDAFQWLNYWGDRPIMETISSLIFDNVFTRFPQL